MSKIQGLTALNREKYNRERIFGVYRGIVEYNVDPMKLGRVKVRIPNLHSTEKSISTEGLPWAYPMHHFGGAHDMGSYYVPSVGATIFVQFEMGDPEHPIYFGTWWKVPPMVREMNTKTSPVDGKVLPERPVSMGQWYQPIGPEAPQEVLSSPYEPTVHVLHKTAKGHTILLEDRDGYEKIRIIDRSGQEIRMTSPITDFFNEQNFSQRNTKSVLHGDNLPYERMAGESATIEFVGASGQGIRIFSKPDNEFIEITSKTDDSKATPSDSQNSIRFLLGGGLGLVELVGKKDGTEILRLQINLNSGTVDLKTTSAITMEAPLLTLLSEILSMKGEVSIEGSLRVKGDSSFIGNVTGIQEAR